MATIVAALPYNTRRQALINLALKRDPVPIRQKPVVSFVNDALSTDGPINELPTFNREISFITPSQLLFDELPTPNTAKKSTSIRSLSSISL
jgi:hypothetical protein